MDGMSNKFETDSEISMSIFEVRSSDEENTSENDRFSKNRYKAVPPPITGNFLTPRADISFAGLDEFAIRKKIIESQTTELNSKTSETAVIIEDWNSDDEEEEYEVQTVKPDTQTVQTRDDKSGQNSKKQRIGFRKVKACFVCKSTNYLIKDYNFHDKKSQESKLKNMVHTGQREGKLVWDNAKRINHQNFSKYPHLSKTFVPSGVLTRTGLPRPSSSTARPVCTARPSVSTARPSVSTARPVCTAKPNVSTARPVYATRPIYPRMDNVRPRGSCSPIKRSYYTKPAFRPKNLKQDVKTFGVQNITTVGTRVVVNTGKDLPFKAEKKLPLIPWPTPTSYSSESVKRRLSKWKMKMLSIGGRLTLVKSVLGSINAPYYTYVDVLTTTGTHYRILESFRDKVWCESGRLKDRFPRAYALEYCKRITVGNKLAHHSLTYSFRREPRGGVEKSQVEELVAMDLIDSRYFPMGEIEDAYGFAYSAHQSEHSRLEVDSSPYIHLYLNPVRISSFKSKNTHTYLNFVYPFTILKPTFFMAPARGFVRLEELMVAANSTKLPDQLLVYFDKETQREAQLANDLSNLMMQLLESENERQSFIKELER
ncbi:hypothetical protein Tco_0511832 [Tanacetum coccineum]